MAGFDDILAGSTIRNSNNVPGCVLSAVDQNGHEFYRKSSGYNSVAPNAPEIDPNGVFWIASCTKLVGTIAAMQCVERRQISLDEPVERILPELSNLDIIKPRSSSTGVGDQPFTLEPSTKKITLRHLLTHTSGLTLDANKPLVAAWRASRQEGLMALSGKLIEGYVVPLSYEPGEGWSYSGGIDLAGEIVKRLNNVSLEQYLRKHIFDPLGMGSTTFRLELHAELAKRMVNTSQRTESGILTESMKLWPDNAQDDCAGAGLYSTSTDYIKVLGDLLRDKPTILKPETVDVMFTPQLEKGSPAMRDLHASPYLTAMTGSAERSGAINWGLGGLYMEEDVQNYKKNTLVWGGLPNLFWFVSRGHGTAGFYASQLLPTGDAKSVLLAQEFIKDVYQTKQLQIVQ